MEDETGYFECTVCCYGTNSERLADKHFDEMLIKHPEGKPHYCY